MVLSENDNAISCQNVSKEFFILDKNFNWKIVFRDKSEHFKSFTALKNINMTIPKGKFIGILGKNGAGKSTLLRTLGGVYHPSSGIIKINGDLSSLFEMGGFGNKRLTGHDYANRFLEVSGINKNKRQQLISNIQEFSELGSFFNKPIYSYSSGMAARLYFSTATEIQHQIYLVDELLSVGDEHFQAKCWKRLRERFTYGSSGILVTHDWSAILKLCEFSYILDKGKIVEYGKSEDVVRQYLQLPIPNKEYAEIQTNYEQLTLQSQSDCEIRFNIILKKDIEILTNYSVEYFRGGYGWEIILMNDNFNKVDCKLGTNSVKIKIKSLPLVTGEYYLNIFLKSSDTNIDPLKLDAKSWTYGNGIKLIVDGTKTEAIVSLPCASRVKA